MIRLDDPALGPIELGGSPFVVASFQIGSRSPRPVMRQRALADGGFDDSRYGGGRAVTVAVRLDDGACDGGSSMQELYDRVLPYMDQALRPVLSWSLPGSSAIRRQMTVRGESAPVVIGARKHPALIMAFVSADGTITSGADEVTIALAGDTTPGRTYPLTYPRSYPDAPPAGERLVRHKGNAAAHWRATIYGPCTNPVVRVNGTEVVCTLVLLAGQTLVIDTKERTVLLNGDPDEPRLNVTNFAAWWWDDLRLKKGENRVRVSASVIGDGAQVVVSWLTTWAG
jgi:hypothetical protein